MILTIATILLSVYVLLGLFIITGVSKIKESVPVTKDLPEVSLLLTCRNEEKDLPACLRSMEQLSYPNELLQIVLIDDNSTDATPELLRAFADRHGHAEFYTADDFPDTHLKGRGRGISRAATKAKGEWLFITDADSVLPEHWIEHMLDGAGPETGLIAGITDTLDHTLVGKMERTISAYTIPIGCGLAGWGLPIHTLGPNMAIKRSVYEGQGGLEQADFKVADDNAMFIMVQKSGYKTIHHVDAHTKVELYPVRSFPKLISQQRRWVKGGFEGSLLNNLIVGLLFFVAFCFSIFTFYLMIVYPPYGFSFALIKMLTDGAIYWQFEKKASIKGLIALSPLSFVYTLISFVIIPLSLLVKPNIGWMGDGFKIDFD